ncbi:MAG: right-handed parallel beta-helix repeat-containing protein [Verrucomicrobiota bacterium]|nr:right-handed parallel beta-helix repeat-containing protein [Verrucomicrobiota bacterium]
MKTVAYAAGLLIVVGMTSSSAATLVVTTAQDSGPGSLREAILTANANPGHDVIQFNIPPSNVVHVIMLASSLPAITDALTIDGLTQPGSAPNSLLQGFNATNLVTLNGHGIPTHAGGGGGPGSGGPEGPGAEPRMHGLEVRADFVTIRGLRLVMFSPGGNMTNLRSAIFVADARNVVVESCVIGVDASTSLGEPNWGGITVTNGRAVRIGGLDPSHRNLISDNTAWQIRFLNSVSNVVEGNFIGLPGLAPAAFLNQGPGVVLEGSHGNRVGGSSAGARNYLAGVGVPPPQPGGGMHDLEGAVLLRNSHSNAVLGNWLGLVPPEVFCRVPQGWTPCGLSVEGVSSGVVLEDAAYNQIGGPAADEANVIVGGGSGIRIEGPQSSFNRVLGNRIGTHPDGTAGSTHHLPFGLLQFSGNHYGVLLRNGARDNRIGGANPGEGNLIANNRIHGIALWGGETERNRVLGNLIGTDITGGEALPNGTFAGVGDGVHLSDGAHDNDIGGPAPGEGNVISGNHNHGVHITGSGTKQNRVRGNIIGPDISGTKRLPYLQPLFPERGNGQSGVRISEGASSNRIGGRDAGEGNLISGNGGFGVELVGGNGVEPGSNEIFGNRIGTRAGGRTALANAAGGLRVASPGNWIGAGPLGAGNLIAGNDGPGVLVEAETNHVQNNFIGTDLFGTSSIPNQLAGVRIRGARNQIGGRGPQARNLISGNAGHGVLMDGPAASGNVCLGNFIGLTASGDAALGNQGDGVHITGDAHGNILGDSSWPNIVSGNGSHGVAIVAPPTTGAGTRSNHLVGNYVGTDAAGLRAVPNRTNGVFVSSAPGCQLVHNVISGNGRHGVELFAADGAVLYENLVGTDRPGTGALPNGGHGVSLRHTTGARLGDPERLEWANRIAFNAAHGVEVRTGKGIRIQANSIYGNGGLGVDLVGLNDLPSGVTPNDPLDADEGPNDLQNFPILTAITTSIDTLVTGRLETSPMQAYWVELFRCRQPDASGHGEGQILVARQRVVTDETGRSDFWLQVPGNWIGWWFAATATEERTGNTSEFGPAVVAAPPLAFAFVRRLGEQVEVGFWGLQGLRYTVWTNGDLSTSRWGAYTNIVARDGINTFRVPVETAPALFFRLQAP